MPHAIFQKVKVVVAEVATDLLFVQNFELVCVGDTRSNEPI